ncbi:MAG: protein kinase [Anaerolineae bacterium]
MALQGQMLGRYRVLDALGRGGMARVYRAYHPRLDRYVAIKVLRSDLVEDTEFLARFGREARAVASLRHPNIVQVYDFDVQDDVYYMVMELLEGDSLKVRLNDYRARGEMMPLGETSRILLDILDGLGYAHGEGMIHRDIKPGNIMLTKHGRAVLTDFGIAQIVGGTRYTVSGALMGTLNYMAPEQGLEGRCDARCDIYSLGIVFYEMLTQRVPFDADTPLAILMKHVNDPLPLPSEQVPDIPEAMEKVVLSALAKQPADRFADAAEMSAALYAACEQNAIDIPERVSMPRSFTIADGPAESIAVLSGTARAAIEDAHFAGDETDTALGQRLANEQQEEYTAPSPETPRNPPDLAPQDRQALAAYGHQGATRHPKSVVSTEALPSDGTPALLAQVNATASRALPALARFLTSEAPGTAARAILSGIGVVLLYNLLAVWVGGLTGRWTLLGRGWPIQLIVIALGLSVIMYSTRVIWLLLPSAILLGNGLLFAYCQITGRWAIWAFLWPLELALIGGSIWVTIQLGHQDDASRPLARPLGCALSIVSALCATLAAGAVTVAGLLQRLLGAVL